MESEARNKLIQLFYETPRAQEIYASLRQQRKEAQRANNESSIINIPDETGDKEVTKLFVKEEKVVNPPGCIPCKPHAEDELSLCCCAPNEESVIPLDKEPQEEFDEGNDEPLCNCDEQSISKMLVSDCENKFLQISHSIEKCHSLSEEDQKQKELLRWSLKIVNGKEIVVEGHRSGDPPDTSWRTSVICDRISTNVVRSKKGTLYFLLGEIDEKDMIEKNLVKTSQCQSTMIANGKQLAFRTKIYFSSEIINMFRFGFPHNWRDIFMKSTPDHRGREVIVPSVKKPSAKPAKDRTNWANHDETNAVDNVDDEVTAKQSEKSSSRRSSQRNATVKESSKRKKTLPTPSRRQRSHQKEKRLASKSIMETNDAQEIEVQRSRSGRVICPVLDYWRGQRISMSPRDGEISIIKSNLEEDSRLTLVETSRSSSGLVQNPTVSSSATGETTSSGTDWAMASDNPTETDSRTSKPSKDLRREKIKTGSRASSQSDNVSDTDTVEEKPKKRSKRISEKQAKTINAFQNRNHQSEESSDSRDSDDQEMSKSSNKKKTKNLAKFSEPNSLRSRTESDKETKTETSHGQTKKLELINTNITGKITKVYPSRKNTREIAEKEYDSVTGVTEQAQPTRHNTKSARENTRKVYPVRTKILRSSIYEQSSASSSKSYASSARTQVQVKDTKNSQKNKLVTQPESQTQPLKKLKGKSTSRAGTLARKRQLRDMLEQQDENYEDDAFEGTPFRNQKLSRKHKVSPVDIADLEDFPEDVDDQDYKTPSSSRTPMNHLRPAGPLSTGKSEIDVMTPGLLNTVNRNNLDRYVNQLRRQRLQNMRKKIESHTPLGNKVKKPSNISNNSITGGKDYSFNVQIAAVDEEEDEDYYWSDNE